MRLQYHYERNYEVRIRFSYSNYQLTHRSFCSFNSLSQYKAVYVYYLVWYLFNSLSQSKYQREYPIHYFYGKKKDTRPKKKKYRIGTLFPTQKDVPTRAVLQVVFTTGIACTKMKKMQLKMLTALVKLIDYGLGLGVRFDVVKLVGSE